MIKFYDHSKAQIAIGGLQQWEIRNKELTHIIITTAASDFMVKIESNVDFHNGILMDNYNKKEIKRMYDIEMGAVDTKSYVINVGHLELTAAESLILYITNKDAAAQTYQITSVEVFESQDFMFTYNRSTVMNNSLDDVTLVMLADNLAATDSVDLRIDGYNTIMTKDAIDSLNALLQNENLDDQTVDVLFYAPDNKPHDITYEIKSITPQTVLYRSYKLDKARVANGTVKVLDSQIKRMETIKKRNPERAKAFQYLGHFPERKATIDTRNYLTTRNNAKKLNVTRKAVR